MRAFASSTVVACLVIAVCGCGSAPSGSHGHRPGSSPSRTSGTPARRVLDLLDPVDVALARDGTLWVADYRDSSITVLRGSRRGVEPIRRVPVTGGPNRLAVDARGRIWAAMWDANRLVAWDPARGPRHPVVVVRSPGMRQPTGLGFDARGWLWVTTQKGHSLLGFAPASLHRSHRVHPARRVALPGGSDALAEDVAFDAEGRAYVVEYQAERLVIFDSLHAGARRPSLVIHLEGHGPVGVRRGPDGAIWVVNPTTADLTRVTDGGRHRRQVRIAKANMPHSITFVGRTAYVTDPTAWLLTYRLSDLEHGAAQPMLVANR